jgi:signal transduction histidine kinase
MLCTILNAAAQGRDLVAGLTEYARKGIPAPREVDLNAVVRSCVELVSPTTVPGIRWQLDLVEELPLILGDAAGLGRVLLNLCRNAVDAMPAGGVLTLGTRPCAARWVELWVADTGPGMAPEVLSRVLEPFFTTKDAGKGTGLGLAIVDAIVQAHAGTLEIQSEEGHGTVVRLRLQVK